MTVRKGATPIRAPSASDGSACPHRQASLGNPALALGARISTAWSRMVIYEGGTDQP